MIFIYSEISTPRLEYIIEYIFKDILKAEFKLISNKNEINAQNYPLINYSNSIIKNAIQIIPNNLLFEKKIDTKLVPNTGKWNNLTTIFPTDKNKVIPFDIFAASFYLISRYEEYTNKKRDKHNRFIATESIAYKNGFLDIPIVDKWILELKKNIERKYQYSFTEKEFSFVPTIDIDNAWAYKNKSFKRTYGGLVKSLFKLKLIDFFKKIFVLFLNFNDPYDSYDFIKKIEEKFHLNHIYFFLNRNSGKYDKSISIKNRRFKKLIKQLSKKNKIGIHPSYTSNSHIALIKEETALLASVAEQKIIRSRNHFLRVKFPKTFKNLIKICIKEDYSLGYSSHIGFRCGTCTPYNFYNLEKNEKTDLKIIPFEVMDATFRFYNKMKSNEILSEIKHIINEIKSVNGTYVSIWHNETLSAIRKNKSWRYIYNDMLLYCTNDKN